MGIFDKLRDIKFEVEMKASDFRYSVSDKMDSVKYFVGDKVEDIKYFVEDKVDDVKYFVEDKVDDVKYFVEDKVDNVKYFVEDKVDDVKYFVGDKVSDVKDFANHKLKIQSKGDAAEFASYVLFPQQIPLRLIMSSVGKNAAANIQGKNDQLTERVQVLEGMQSHGSELEGKIKNHFSSIQSIKTQLHANLMFFAECLERIHNRPTYGIKGEDSIISFDELFETSEMIADFGKFDEYLVNLYDENASILQGLLRSPLFAAIMKFREKALMNKIDDVLAEVNECIENMRPLVQYLNQLNLTTAKFEKELHEVEAFFNKQIKKLSDIVDEKSDFDQFTDSEITILDTNIKLVRIIVSLLNIHVFNVNEISEQGFAKVNTTEVIKVVKESELVRQQSRTDS